MDKDHERRSIRLRSSVFTLFVSNRRENVDRVARL